LEQYQTLLVGGLGFAGVVITLLVNARQTRKQRREERLHERQTLRAALIEELRIIRGALIRETERGANDTSDADGYAVPTDAMDDAYRSFTDRIGLLSSEEVRTVMSAYLTLRTYYASLLLIGAPLDAGGQYIKVPRKNAQLLFGFQHSLISPIDEAIGALERARDAAARRWRVWGSRTQRVEAGQPRLLAAAVAADGPAIS
jgi:hypothetical protein